MSWLTLVQQSSSPGAPGSGQARLFFDNQSPPNLKYIDPSGNVRRVDDNRSLRNASTSSVSGGYASDTYLAGSSIVVPAGAWVAGTTYYCAFDMTKTGAGTAAFTTTVRLGTAGTTADTSRLSLAFAVGTANADTGLFEVFVNFRSIGASGVIAGGVICSHHLAATGLITTGASGTGIILATSSSFDTTTPTTIGLSVNGGSSFSGTNTFVQAQLQGI